MSVAFLMAILGLIGVIGYLGIVGALHVLPTGYQPVRHAVSDYGVGRYGPLFRRALGLSSLGVLFLAIGLALNPGAPPLAVSQLVFLFLVPVMRMGMVRFPTDLEGHSLTPAGRRHYAFAIAAFAFTYAAISGMTSRLTSPSPWSSAHGLLSVLDWVTMVALILVVVTLLPPLRRVFGLFERAFLLSSNLWLITVGICLVIVTA